MIEYPTINPVLLDLGILQIRWYGLLYIISFAIGYFFLKHNLKKKNIVLPPDSYENFLFYLMLGVVIGGRMGYVLFYNLSDYLSHPLHIFAVWEGGMSFHGGALGVIISGYIYCYRNKLDFYSMADPTMPLVAVGLGLGRLGNFINAELYGRVTNVPWAMIFPNSDGQPRHPSQLYELFLEGILLSLLLQFILVRTKVTGLIFWFFILFYGIFRYFIEYLREPDVLDVYAKGMILNYFTIGQVLSLLMIISGIAGSLYCVYRYKQKLTQKIS